jgi:hypothetical protein
MEYNRNYSRNPNGKAFLPGMLSWKDVVIQTSVFYRIDFLNFLEMKSIFQIRQNEGPS